MSGDSKLSLEGAGTKTQNHPPDAKVQSSPTFLSRGNKFAPPSYPRQPSSQNRRTSLPIPANQSSENQAEHVSVNPSSVPTQPASKRKAVSPEEKSAQVGFPKEQTSDAGDKEPAKNALGSGKVPPSRRTEKCIRVTSTAPSVVKQDRYARWERLAAKNKNEYLRNRNQKMIRDRLQKYRLVPSESICESRRTLQPNIDLDEALNALDAVSRRLLPKRPLARFSASWLSDTAESINENCFAQNTNNGLLLAASAEKSTENKDGKAVDQMPKEKADAIETKKVELSDPGFAKIIGGAQLSATKTPETPVVRSSTVPETKAVIKEEVMEVKESSGEVLPPDYLVCRHELPHPECLAIQREVAEVVDAYEKNRAFAFTHSIDSSVPALKENTNNRLLPVASAEKSIENKDGKMVDQMQKKEADEVETKRTKLSDPGIAKLKHLWILSQQEKEMTDDLEKILRKMRKIRNDIWVAADEYSQMLKKLEDLRDLKRKVLDL